MVTYSMPTVSHNDNRIGTTERTVDSVQCGRNSAKVQ